MTEVTELVSQMARKETNFQSMALEMITEPKVRHYIKESTIIENLFEYGQTSRRVRFPTDSRYFESVRDVKTQMSQLFDYWRGSVDITYCVADESMVEIFFRVKRVDEF
jgi:hypothetical protein